MSYPGTAKKRARAGHLRVWPDDIMISSKIIEKVNNKWSGYGLD